MNFMIQWLSGVLGEIVTEETMMEVVAGFAVVAMASIGFWVLTRKYRWSKLDRDIAAARRDQEVYTETKV